MRRPRNTIGENDLGRLSFGRHKNHPPLLIEIDWHDATGAQGTVDVSPEALSTKGKKLTYAGYLVDISNNFITTVSEYTTDSPDDFRDRSDIPIPDVLKIRDVRTGRVLYDRDKDYVARHARVRQRSQKHRRKGTV